MEIVEIRRERYNQMLDLLRQASKLVGNPGVNISGSTDYACQKWQADYLDFKFFLPRLAAPKSEEVITESKEKSLFQILDEMILEDCSKGSSLVQISNTLLSGDKVKQGAKISMGATEAVLLGLLSGQFAALLIVVDKNEYIKRQLKK